MTMLRRPFTSYSHDFLTRLAPSQYKSSSLRMLLQGCTGAWIGVVMAIALAHALLPPDGRPASTPAGLLSWTLENIRLEPREKGFYLLSLLFGPAGAFFATQRLFRGFSPYFAIAVFLAAALPLGNAYAQASLQGNLPAWFGLTVAALLAGMYLSLLKTQGADAKFENVVATESKSNRSLFTYILILAFLALCIVPSSFQAIAARVGMEQHVVSFFIGPSLYFLGHGLLPGVDYYTQYGLGLGWIFSFFLGANSESTLVHYVVIVVVGLWLFFAHLIWLLRWLYQSWLAAAVVSFLMLFLLFHTDRQFFDPSSFVLRYPLLTICGALLVRWVIAPGDWIRLVFLALALAAALFIETETGIIIAVSVALAFMLVSPWRFTSIVSMAVLGAATSIFFIIFLILVFGQGVLTKHFISGLIEPLTIYGVAGFGAWPIAWTLREWGWLYNFVAPGIALATLGIIARSARVDQIDRPRAGLVVFFSACGLLMSAKFINMSIFAVWQMNALGFFVVLGWWASSIARNAPRRVQVRQFAAVPLRAAIVALMIVPAVALATTSSDQRNPTLYGFRSWMKYPSLLSSLLPFHSLKGCIHITCIANRPDPRDVALIRDRTRPGEQVAIVGDLFDWTYLVDAHRPPMLAFLPSLVIFTERQLDESWKRMAVADYWFIPRGTNGDPKIGNPDLRVLAMPVLHRDFVLDGVANRLSAWKRKSPGAKDQTGK
jgi:hypothetical protein